jgi:hypothetical protein
MCFCEVAKNNARASVEKAARPSRLSRQAGQAPEALGACMKRGTGKWREAIRAATVAIHRARSPAQRRCAIASRSVT